MHEAFLFIQAGKSEVRRTINPRGAATCNHNHGLSEQQEFGSHSTVQAKNTLQDTQAFCSSSSSSSVTFSKAAHGLTDYSSTHLPALHLCILALASLLQRKLSALKQISIIIIRHSSLTLLLMSV